MREYKVYRQLASSCDARLRCAKTLNTHQEWFDRHTETIENIVRDFLPHGSGIDSGVTFDFDLSTGEKLVLHTSYHHMNENGFYDGWTEHTVTVRSSLIHGISISISGRNRNEIKDYLAEMFSEDLDRSIYWDDAKQRYTRTIGGNDPFSDVPDWERCTNCHGKASESVNGFRYCAGCATLAKHL